MQVQETIASQFGEMNLFKERMSSFFHYLLIKKLGKQLKNTNKIKWFSPFPDIANPIEQSLGQDFFRRRLPPQAHTHKISKLLLCIIAKQIKDIYVYELNLFKYLGVTSFEVDLIVSFT